MKITELIIDGYKSYAVRTVISGWDDSFNSITGLNGSGKSNILDAICFVLGITNLGVVRAQNLQDLIYKRGQAGVTKASVTITFDNRDKKTSPVSFDHFDSISVTRTIVLGGASKYLINGTRAQQQTVQNLFQSVQLNINNPNFLIMQGRVTKVLNMKPVEILAMLEEAAGTRMFEDRRDKAYKTMAKKESKVQEIKELLRDEIDPKLEKLRQEKRAFLDFQQTQSELEKLTKLVIAYDYTRLQRALQQSGDDLEAKKQRAQDLEQSAARMKKEIDFLQEDIKKVKATRERELRKGGRFQALEEEVKANSHEVVRLDTSLDLKRTSMAEETERQKTIEKSVKDLEKQLSEKKKVHEKLQERYQSARDELAKQTEEVEKKEELLQTLQTGVASKEGQESGYQGQLQDARNRVSAAATEQEQAKLKISHLEKQIKEDEPKAKKAKQQNSGLLNDLEVLKSQAQKLESDLTKMGFDEGKEAHMYQQESHLQARIRELKQQADELKRRVSNIDFSYSDPSPNFDRSKVKGLVAQLFTLNKEHTAAGTALEVAAGGRLYNVVVDSAATGKQLLENGRLKKRVTIIPLNKIAAFRASAQKVGAAQKIAPGKVNLALSLVGYEDEVNAAMEYVFGSTLVCEDAETAKRVTFDPAVRMRSVTFQGDTYDPAGTLSGGSAPQSSGVLVTMQKLNEITTELRSQEQQLRQLQETMLREKKRLDAARKAKQELDLKKHEIKLTEEQISGNSSSSIIQAIEEMKQSVAQLKEDIKSAKARQDEAKADIKRIERDMSEFNNNKDSKLAELQSSLEKLKKALTKTNAAIKPLQAEVREAMVESEQCGSDLAAAQEQLEDVQTTLKTQQEEIDELLAEQKQAQNAHDIAQAQLSDEQAKLTGFDEELRSLEDTIRAKNSSITEGGLEQQKLAHEIEKFNKESEGATGHIAALEKEHDFIASDAELFGRAGTVYDFNGVNMADCKSKRKNLEERFQQRKNKINPKVMAMIDNVEKKEASLKNNMATVVKDKKKIEDTIVKLDEYKKEALHKTWTKVNKDFGDIFNEILPGSYAKLDPPEGKTIADGLEVKVMLGKVWKQSLTELSGGQRSLIALSLIMALLQFKPAPMYILDEVDAALDISHTQNIGHLIKTRFKGSQFIVVSLKDGMFQNANRLFRTKFVDGTSVPQTKTQQQRPQFLSQQYATLQEHATAVMQKAHADEDTIDPRLKGRQGRRGSVIWSGPSVPEDRIPKQSRNPMMPSIPDVATPPTMDRLVRRRTSDSSSTSDAVFSRPSTTRSSDTGNETDSSTHEDGGVAASAISRRMTKKCSAPVRAGSRGRILSFQLPMRGLKSSFEKVQKRTPVIEEPLPSQSPGEPSSPRSDSNSGGLAARRQIKMDLSLPKELPDSSNDGDRNNAQPAMLGGITPARPRSPPTPWPRDSEPGSGRSSKDYVRGELFQLANTSKSSSTRRWPWKKTRRSDSDEHTHGINVPTDSRKSISANIFKRSNRFPETKDREQKEKTSKKTSSIPWRREKTVDKPPLPSASLAKVPVPPMFVPPGCVKVPTPPEFDQDREVRGKLADFFFDTNGFPQAKRKQKANPKGYWDSNAVLMSMQTDFDPTNDEDEEGPEGRPSPAPFHFSPVNEEVGAPGSPGLHTGPEDYLTVERPPKSPNPSSPAAVQDSWFRMHYSDTTPDAEPTATALHEMDERRKFEWLVPEHLPNSPLCPLHVKYVGPSKGLCYWHGRKSNGWGVEPRRDYAKDPVKIGQGNSRGWEVGEIPKVPQEKKKKKKKRRLSSFVE
ncbi:Structural maintenance of chromosomes protein 2 [Curvularia kusanoi]|uniref:Structural maintenance of chromosomes protein 2 n=1 Tax=Curvularia kusanoi TaxID=90978 RepID=A0A9P4W5B5_CURKU|nr:Structural maintenance of chromosomes protein 2 [Curvularia kusanoi]